ANTMIQKMVLSGKKDEISSIIEKMSSQPIPNKMFRNNGDLTFKDMGKDWGLDIPSFSNGAAYGDLDNDGDLDMVVNNNNMPSFVFKNKSREKNKNGYIGFKIKGLPENINAVGAKINVFIQGQILSKEVIPARGFQSSVDYKQIFGLGKFTKIDSVQVIWPNLTQSILKIQKLDSVYTIDQATQIVQPFVVQQEKVAPIFEEVKANFEKHTEDDHVDFYAERIIPRILSQEGPKATSADINGDGLSDLFIGGANNKGSQIYLQTTNGDFKPKPQTAFSAFTSYEDVAAVFFDADKDGDMDLLVGSGGNNRLSNRGELNHRLFLNDGKANFTHLADAFPVFEYNTGVMVPLDYDLDGDLDVFVGARNTPLKYGVTPSSALYQNDGSGKFKDVTSTIAPDFLKLGMVTSAVWGKITNKQSSNLIVVGDYMYPVIYAFEKGKMVEQASNLNGMSGWWQSIQMADIDGDGFQDLIIGNMGENGYLKPNPTAPVKLWINDFDGNESIDKILTRTVDGKDVPVFMKGEMQEQIPLLKKENLNYEIYAKKAFQELFKKELVDKAAMKLYNYTSSIIAWGKGNGQFDIQRLPNEVQFSSLNAMVSTDVNADGKTDLVLGGNQFGFLPQFGRLDANYGLVLINKGKRVLEVVEDKQSGLAITGQVRDMVLFQQGVQKKVLFFRNNQAPVFMKLK
ncbi:MAG: FG-GAP-like repeat-containing protein, partial [Sediminibacterium sp.]